MGVEIKCDSCGKDVAGIKTQLICGKDKNGKDDELWCENCVLNHISYEY